MGAAPAPRQVAGPVFDVAAAAAGWLLEVTVGFWDPLGLAELSAGSGDWKTGFPRDFGFLVLTPSDPAEKMQKLAAEIANGRLAMMAFFGVFFLDDLTGSAWGDLALFSVSPLRAREPKVARQFFGGGGSTSSCLSFDPATELGVQDPVGFGVPLGLAELSAGSDDWKTGFPGVFGFEVLTSSDPAEQLKQLPAEIANGRLAMMAIIGMFIQEGLIDSLMFMLRPGGGDGCLAAGRPPPIGGGPLAVGLGFGFRSDRRSSGRGKRRLFGRLALGSAGRFETLKIIIRQFHVGYHCLHVENADASRGSVVCLRIKLHLDVLVFCQHLSYPRENPYDLDIDTNCLFAVQYT